MIKFEVLAASEEGLAYEKLHENIPYEDIYYKITHVYLDITKVESIEYCNRYKGSDCSNINMYSGDKFTLVINMDKLSDMVVKAKQNNGLMNYNN